MWAEGQDVAESEYKTDAAAKPAAIDMKFEGHTTLGIYDVNGNRLRLCLVEGDKARPKEFSSEGDATLMTLKRVPFHGTSLFTMKADGTDLHQLPPHPVFTAAGSPNMSRDGTRLAWDAWRSVLGETYTPAHVLVAGADGRGAKDFGKGRDAELVARRQADHLLFLWRRQRPGARGMDHECGWFRAANGRFRRLDAEVVAEEK